MADVRTQVYPDGAARSPGVAATGTRSTTQIIPDKPTSAPASGLWETVDVSDSRVYLASVSAAKINAAPRLVEVTQQSVSAIDQIIPVLYGYPHWLGLRLAGMVVDQYGQLLLLGALGYGELANIDGAYIDNVPAATVGMYYGTTTQNVDTQLKNAYAFRGVTFADTMRGFAYVRVTLPTSVAIQGAPNFVVKCGNKKIIDMRTGTWATGDQPSNPVLCLADYISSTVYGMGGQYNVASFSAAANFCDEAVVGAARRYRMALALTTQQKVDDWLNQITAYTGCILWRRAGVYYLTPLRARPVTLTLGKRNIVQGSLDMDLRSQRDLPTHVTVNYTDWTASPPSTRPTTQPANVPDDGRESTLQLPGIVSQEMASRIAGRRYNQIQYSQLAASWRAFDEAINYRPGDVLALSFPEYGLSGAKFAITSLVDQGFGRWSVNSESYSDAMFVDDPLPPPPSILDPGTLVPPSNVAPGLAGPVTMVEELIQFANGDFRPRLRIDWPDGTGAISFYAIAILDVTAGVYVETSNMPMSEYISTAVDEQHVYRAYVAAVGPTGLVSQQIASSDVLVLGKTAPPSDVANFVAIEAGGNVYCSWNAIPDLDRDEYEIRRGTVGQAWSAMVPVSKLQATNTVLNSQPMGTVDYAIKAKDTTGHYSVTEARQTVVVTADQNLNVVGPNPFLGYTTTNCQVWTPYSTTVPVMVNTDLAGVWGDGATDPNDNTGTFNDVLTDVIIASPNAVAATMQTTPYDFGVLINTRVSCTSPYTLLSGPAGGVVTTVETSTDGVTYTAIAINELRTVRYVRCRLNIAAGTVIRSLQNWTVSLVAVLTTEQGSVSVGASGKATITLQSRYSAWVAIQVTPQGNTANVTATFDNVIVGIGVTNTFDVWYFKSNAPAAGTASWAFRGIR